MFKGLRTKIESEQRGQTSNANPKSSQQAIPQTPGERSKIDIQSNKKSTQSYPAPGAGGEPSSNVRASNQSIIPASQTSSDASNVRSVNLKDSEPLDSSPQARTEPSSLSGLLDKQIDLGDEEQLNNQNADHTGSQIARLKEQLHAVMREKDECNDQNAQLYQLIEKLRRNLETEQETKSSLQTRLDELEKLFKEKTDSASFRANNNNVAFTKSFNPDLMASDASVPNDVEALRNEVIELQAQLAKKNRQLKIRQQNLTDIKRTLQKEILDHGRTQEELARLQRQLQTPDQQQAPQQGQMQNPSGREKATVASQNGSRQADQGDASAKINLNQASGDKSQEHGQSSGSQISGGGGTGEDTISLNTALGLGGNVQFDRSSCLSRSSASVDDFESNDLQQSNYNKEVSHEYLRNVLYRYMTSTDTETTQHLVKAISVLMDFSPEQAAAIKSAMNSRSSWLRLK